MNNNGAAPPPLPADVTGELEASPYLGPRSFGADDRQHFFGRDEELELLCSLVLTHREVVLFAVSGAGKSSLLQAGLLPLLTREQTLGRGRFRRSWQKLEVLPVATVAGALPDGLDPAEVHNIFVFNTLSSLLGGVPPAELAGISLGDGLQRYSDENYRGEEQPVAGDLLSPNLDTLLVFDQFEQLFTHHTDRWQERESFFVQLLEARQRFGDLRLLFSLREDYLGELTPYAHRFSGGLSARFRLQRLRRQAALEAVQKPAAAAGCPFTDEAAQLMVDNLSREQSGHGEFVEPVQLQVVCHELWGKLPPGQRCIESSLLSEVGDVDQALGNYWRAMVERVSRLTSVPQRTIRQWVEQQLVIDGRLRGQVPRVDESRQGLDHASIEGLVDAHLLRAVERRKCTWFELAHDRLVGPLLADNQIWREQNLEPLQVQAALWDQRKRPDSLLLRGASLDEAATWSQRHLSLLNEVERQFMERCLAMRKEKMLARDQHVREQRQTLELERSRAVAETSRRHGRIVKATLAACLVLMVAGFIGWYKSYKDAAHAHKMETAARSSAERERQQKRIADEQRDTADRALKEVNKERARAVAARARAEWALGRERETRKNARKHQLASKNRGTIACYSPNSHRAVYPVREGVYMMGLIPWVVGRYEGSTFRPGDFKGKLLRESRKYNRKCNEMYPAGCKGGCWASGDTGKFYGYKRLGAKTPPPPKP